LADKVQAYVGDGSDLYAYVPGGEIGTIARPTHNGKESGTYFAGEVLSSPTAIIGVNGLTGLGVLRYPCPNWKLLVVYCEFKNVFAATHTFNPLQVEFGGKAGALMAAGFDSSPHSPKMRPPGTGSGRNWRGVLNRETLLGLLRTFLVSRRTHPFGS
jgi:hypothetical protein